ncbi:OBP3-responsive protein 1 [Forsythia ovata]|uniref:OBP3-responsive protein 1 n=1 Tax=Forsythia ovata TaxID=205694 RepID=A0ABD1SQH0_9LAMI
MSSNLGVEEHIGGHFDCLCLLTTLCDPPRPTNPSRRSLSTSLAVTASFTEGDEVVYEATMKDARSPLYNKRVVLWRLISAQAKRRGRRAIEVLKRLARRRLMYNSYAMNVHGYVCASTKGDSDLARGVFY